MDTNTIAALRRAAAAYAERAGELAAAADQYREISGLLTEAAERLRHDPSLDVSDILIAAPTDTVRRPFEIVDDHHAHLKRVLGKPVSAPKAP